MPPTHVLSGDEKECWIKLETELETLGYFTEFTRVSILDFILK